MYKVIKPFVDLQDNDHDYKVGDEYPRKGANVTDARIAELAGTANRQNAPLITKVNGAAPKQSLDPVVPAQSKTAEQETPPQKESSLERKNNNGSNRKKKSE